MADNKRDYYEVLGVAKTASEDDLKKAYRKLAKTCHPDLHPGDKEAEAKFKELNDAYAILSDPEKRAKYDQFGFAGVDPNYGAGQGGGFGGYGGFGGGFGGDFDLGSIFDTFFGGGFGGASTRGRNAPRRGETIQLEETVTFEEAAFGCEREIRVNRVESCTKCGGSGSADGKAETCQTCRGTGQVRTTRSTPLGTIASTSACPNCHGTGKIIKNPCPDCRGEGRVRKTRKLKVNIPAGIDDGQSISLRGEGSAGINGGSPGDVIITIAIAPHKFFSREGSSVMCEIPISITQAALGAEVEVLTLDGNVKYTVPEGTQTGTVFRLKGRGIPQLNGRGRGDQYVRVYVDVPKNLTEHQRDLLRQFGETLGQTSERKKGFFDKRKGGK